MELHGEIYNKMKRITISAFLLITCFHSFYWHKENQEQYLFNQYNERYISAIKSNNHENIIRLAEEIESIIAQNDNEKLQLMYVNILISQLRNYPKAVAAMEIIPSVRDNAALLLGLCLLKERLDMPYEACYRKVMEKLSEPKYNDMNYWGVVGALKLPYSESDIEKSDIPRTMIEAVLNPNRQEFLLQMFP